MLPVVVNLVGNMDSNIFTITKCVWMKILLSCDCWKKMSTT